MAAQPAMQPVLAKRPQDDRPTPISIKVLLCVSVVLLAAVLYNAMGGGWQATRGRRSGRIHEATLPLQKRPRKSKYAHTADEDEPDQVVVPTNATAAAKAAGVPPTSVMPSGGASSRPVGSAAAAPPLPFEARVDNEAGTAGREFSCHARDGYDIAGDAAYVWGLAFNVGSAAECCQACAAHRSVCADSAAARGKPFWRASRRERTQARCSGAPGLCNAWVYCAGTPDPRNPELAERCFSYTIAESSNMHPVHVHTCASSCASRVHGMHTQVHHPQSHQGRVLAEA